MNNLEDREYSTCICPKSKFCSLAHKEQLSYPPVYAGIRQARQMGLHYFQVLWTLLWPQVMQLRERNKGRLNTSHGKSVCKGISCNLMYFLQDIKTVFPMYSVCTPLFSPNGTQSSNFSGCLSLWTATTALQPAVDTTDTDSFPPIKSAPHTLTSTIEA